MTAYTLTAETGTYTLTGETVTFTSALVLSAVQGTYTLAGQAQHLIRASRPDQSCSNCYFAANQTQQQEGQPVTVLTCRIAAPAQIVPRTDLATDMLPGRWPQVDSDDWCGYWSGTAVPAGRNCSGCFFLGTRTQRVNGTSTLLDVCQFSPPTATAPRAELATDVLPAAWPSVDPVADWCGQWIVDTAPRGPTWRQPANVNRALAIEFDFSGSAGAGGAPGTVQYIVDTIAALTKNVDIYMFGASEGQVAAGNPYTYLLLNTGIAQGIPTTSVGLWPGSIGTWTVVIASTTTSGGGGGGDGTGGAGGGDGGGDE